MSGRTPWSVVKNGNDKKAREAFIMGSLTAMLMKDPEFEIQEADPEGPVLRVREKRTRRTYVIGLSEVPQDV